MNRFAFVVTMVGALTLVVTPPSSAQGGPGRSAGGAGGRMYDQKSVETVSGQVAKVEQIPARGRGGPGGIHLLLRTDKEEIPVHLGPAWYINKQPVKIAAQDTIEVRGSRVTFEGKPAIIAAEVKRGDQTLKLRDENGVPVWSGSRRKK